jgi:type II secretory pathway pseudopilin PulG
MAMTLVELLTVIAIIAVLAGMLLPALSGGKNRARKVLAGNDITQLKNAISSYFNDYSKYPASDFAYNSASAGLQLQYDCPSFTFGTAGLVNFTNFTVTNLNLAPITPFRYEANNSEVIGILKNWTNFPNGGGVWNTNYTRNPHKNDYLGGKIANDIVSPGIGLDGVFRDPWKHPYIISMDLSFSKFTRDSFYRSRAVSQSVTVTGYNGLANQLDVGINGNGNNFDYNGGIMVWSAGLDGLIDQTVPATLGANADNIRSW